MTRPRLTAALAATVLLAGLTSCSGDRLLDGHGRRRPSTSSEDRCRPVADGRDRRPSTPRSASPSRTASTPTSATRRSTRSTTTSTSTWDPDGRTLTGTETLTFRSTADADHVQLDLAEQLEVSAAGGRRRGRLSSSTTARTSSSRGDFAADERYELSIDYSGTPEPVPAPTTRRDFSTTGFTDHRRRIGVDDAGAVRRLLLVRRQRPAVRQGVLRLHPALRRRRWTGVANGELTSREEEDGDTVDHDWHLDSKTSSYLVTVAFGDYKVTEDESASGVPISYWVPTSAPAVPRRAALHPRGPRLGRGQARPLPVVVARRPPRRLPERHGDPDDDHAGRHPLRHQQGRARPRDRPPVVRRPGHAVRLERPLDERGHGDVPPARLAGRGHRRAARPDPPAGRRAPSGGRAGSTGRRRPTTRRRSARPRSTTAPR